MIEERKKILEMLAEKKITVDEAERLLAALAAPASGSSESGGLGKIPWKYLRVVVEPGPGSEHGDKVNIRVPMTLIRAGLKWAALIPKHAQGDVNRALQEKGIDFDFSKIKPEDLEDILSNLDELVVDVDGRDKVRVFCE